MSLPALLVDSPNNLSIPAEFLSSLETRQDYEAAFSTVSQSKNQMIWWEADLILAYYKKFLGQHLDVYRAGQLMNNTTIKYYLRTASGFPAEFRLPSISFNHHYQATFADEWDSKTLKFQGDKRFTYVEKAADESMSTRKLKETIDIENEAKPKREELVCDWCKNKEGLTAPVISYVVYKKDGKKNSPLDLPFHEFCFDKLLDYVNEF